MREQPPQASVGLAHGRDPILYLPNPSWYCEYREEHEGFAVRLMWIVAGEVGDIQHLGRCPKCGQKYILGELGDEHVPTVAEQLQQRAANAQKPSRM